MPLTTDPLGKVYERRKKGCGGLLCRNMGQDDGCRKGSRHTKIFIAVKKVNLPVTFLKDFLAKPFGYWPNVCQGICSIKAFTHFFHFWQEGMATFLLAFCPLLLYQIFHVNIAPPRSREKEKKNALVKMVT